MVETARVMVEKTLFKRRDFLRVMGAASLIMPGVFLSCEKKKTRPNILFAISDDQSWLHAGAYGDSVVMTPNFDRVANDGVLFTHAYCAAPSCTPSRGGILTGQHVWRLEEGGNLWSTLPAKIPVYTDLLKQAGYHGGYMGKGWGPGKVEPGGRKTNPAGPNRYKDFGEFTTSVPEGEPWCFWFGSTDPHRTYELGSGVASGMKIEDVRVPPVWPDVSEVRGDICDYFWEIQRFDRNLGHILDSLERDDQLHNTLIVITSDNGMPFPRGKANLYDLGTRMPLAIAWKGHIPGGRIVDDFVSHTDLAPTFLEATGQPIPEVMTGRSLMAILGSRKSGRVDLTRDHVFTARERHAWVRQGGLGYPSRAIRNDHFLYIRNYEPDRWPAGDPPFYGDIDSHDLGYYAPTKEYMMRHRDDPDVQPMFELAFEKRPREELYDTQMDPHQMNNVAEKPEYARVREGLSDQLDAYLRETGDPRTSGEKTNWDSWPYYGRKEPRPRADAPLSKTL